MLHKWKKLPFLSLAEKQILDTANHVLAEKQTHAARHSQQCVLAICLQPPLRNVIADVWLLMSNHLVQMYEQSMNHTSLKKTGLDVMPSHPLC